MTSLAVVAAGEAGSDGTAGRVVKDGGWAVPTGAEVCLWRRRGRGEREGRGRDRGGWSSPARWRDGGSQGRGRVGGHWWRRRIERG